jgi:hypothetical protein
MDLVFECVLSVCLFSVRATIVTIYITCTFRAPVLYNLSDQKSRVSWWNHDPNLVMTQDLLFHCCNICLIISRCL